MVHRGTRGGGYVGGDGVDALEVGAGEVGHLGQVAVAEARARAVARERLEPPCGFRVEG